jgi:hypothetical protein
MSELSSLTGSTFRTCSVNYFQIWPPAHVGRELGKARLDWEVTEVLPQE